MGCSVCRLLVQGSPIQLPRCCSPWGQATAGGRHIGRLAAKHSILVAACAGLANPGPVAAALWTDEQLEAGVVLDSVVTVADATHIVRRAVSRHACLATMMTLQVVV